MRDNFSHLDADKAISLIKANRGKPAGCVFALMPGEPGATQSNFDTMMANVTAAEMASLGIQLLTIVAMASPNPAARAIVAILPKVFDLAVSADYRPLDSQVN